LGESNWEEDKPMTQTGNTLEQEKRIFVVPAHFGIDIERICEGQSEKENPPEVFLLSSECIGGHLLAVESRFLEQGQNLTCPGLPLVGAPFGPGWGFSEAVVGKRSDGSAEFQLPPLHSEILASGDTWGYRLCILEDRELPEAIAQLTRIRQELAKGDSEGEEPTGRRVTISPL
jgi:hypothetical protein